MYWFICLILHFPHDLNLQDSCGAIIIAHHFLVLGAAYTALYTIQTFG